MLGEDVVRKVVRDEIYGGEMRPHLDRQSPYHRALYFALLLYHTRKQVLRGAKGTQRSYCYTNGQTK